MAKYIGSAANGLGFCYLEVPESSRSASFRFNNCGIIIIDQGEITLDELEKDLANIFYAPWPWQIRQMEEFRYLYVLGRKARGGATANSTTAHEQYPMVL